VNAKDGALRIADDFGGEQREFIVERVDEGAERLLEFDFICIPMRLEPEAIVVLLEIAQKSERGWREAAEVIVTHAQRYACGGDTTSVNRGFTLRRTPILMRRHSS
jgi:hypothetical protein